MPVPNPTSLNAVTVTYDGGDIDGNGNWYGEEMCCLECGFRISMRMILADAWNYGLTCGWCGEVFAKVPA